MASVPITVLLYNGPLLAHEGLIDVPFLLLQTTYQVHQSNRPGLFHSIPRARLGEDLNAATGSAVPIVLHSNCVSFA